MLPPLPSSLHVSANIFPFFSFSLSGQSRLDKSAAWGYKYIYYTHIHTHPIAYAALPPISLNLFWRIGKKNRLLIFLLWDWTMFQKLRKLSPIRKEFTRRQTIKGSIVKKNCKSIFQLIPYHRIDRFPLQKIAFYFPVKPRYRYVIKSKSCWVANG